MVGFVILALAVTGLVWLIVAAERDAARQHERDLEWIRQFPPDVQVRLWAAKCRSDADNDRW